MADEADKKLGNILIEKKYVTSEDVAEALHLQQKLKAEKKQSLKLGQLLVFLKKITVEQLHDALRGQTVKAARSREHAVEAKNNAPIKPVRSAPVKEKDPGDLLGRLSKILRFRS